MLISHRWSPITDLPVTPEELTDGELNSLARVWATQQADLAERGVLDEFNRRLGREWSIETGIIENVYTLDRGVTGTLIEKGIDSALIPHGASNKDGVAVARIIQDHYDALEGMFDFVGGQRTLSTGYVKELHASLLRNQPSYAVVDSLGRLSERTLELGKYKDLPNSPTRPDGTLHQYCPPEHVASEMDRLIQIHKQQIARNVPAEVQAAWLHHRFTQIHPFADGNGRVARALASLVFIKAGWFPLIVKRDDWTRYIDALEKADEDDLRPLVELCTEAQRTAVIVASEIAYDLAPITSIDDAVSAIRDRMLLRGTLPLERRAITGDVASRLLGFSLDRFHSMANQLNQEIASPMGKDLFSASASPASRQPEFGEFSAVCSLKRNSGLDETLALTFHSIGTGTSGLVGVTAYLTKSGDSSTPIAVAPFLINYEEPSESIQSRYGKWLQQVIMAGLNQWRRSF